MTSIISRIPQKLHTILSFQNGMNSPLLQLEVYCLLAFFTSWQNIQRLMAENILNGLNKFRCWELGLLCVIATITTNHITVKRKFIISFGKPQTCLLVYKLSVINIGSDAFSNPIFQKVLKNQP